MLADSGVLHAGPDQKLLGRDGRQAAWMFYSWGCTLTGDGLRLAGEVLLDALRSFESTQLASYGYYRDPSA